MTGDIMAKILIIDDNAIMRKNIWFMLRREGHSLLEAEDGPTGIALARSEQPDLVLLDFMLPYMSGEQVARYFFDHEDLNQIPIIVLTAMNQPELVMNMLKLNVRDYLLKPIRAGTLRDRVKGLLGSEEPEPQPEPAAEPDVVTQETEDEAHAETETVKPPEPELQEN
jgi:DNA-binding response OmpR family regulator